MIKVQVRPNEPVEAALRRFKRQCNYAGIFRLAKKFSFHEKRSDKNRREERERVRNIQRAMRKINGATSGRGRRRAKMRTSSVTPESAKRAAEEAMKAKQLEAEGATTIEPTVTPTTAAPAPGTVRIGSAEAVIGETKDGGES